MPSILTIGQQNIDNSKDELIRKFEELDNKADNLNYSLKHLFQVCFFAHLRSCKTVQK